MKRLLILLFCLFVWSSYIVYAQKRSHELEHLLDSIRIEYKFLHWPHP